MMQPAPKSTQADDLAAAFQTFTDSARALEASYRELAETLEGQARRSRLDLMGEQFARLAHQLRTPLSAALLYAAPLRNPELPAHERARFGERLLDRLRHMERMIAELLAYSRGPMLRVQTLNLAELYQALQQRVGPMLEAAGAELVPSGPLPGVALEADGDGLVEALTNLIDNSLRACPQGARIELAAELCGRELVLQLSDNGPGIDAALAERVFRPFVTTRADGTGLGLPVAQDRIRAHGGRLQLRPTPSGERGARFEIRLPLGHAPAARAAGG